MENILKTRKEELVRQIGEDRIKKLKKVKLLKLMELEIQQLLKYWNLSQILEIVNSELGFKISKTVFYDFCKKNIKEDKTSKLIKRDSQKQIEVDKDISQVNQVKENFKKGQLMIAQTTELKDDGQLKVADKSEFI
jgi:hypothetical protein